MKTLCTLVLLACAACGGEDLPEGHAPVYGRPVPAAVPYHTPPTKRGCHSRGKRLDHGRCK